MDRIQRVFKVADFDKVGAATAPTRPRSTKKLSLTVPPLPRRLASVIKGQVRNGKRAPSFYNFEELEEPETPLGGKNLWGDQGSLAIFEQKFSGLLRRPAAPKSVTETGRHVKVETLDRSKQKKTDPAKALICKEKPLPKQGPFTNRYIYRQLSDSVLHEPGPNEHNLKEYSVDVSVFLAERKVLKDQEMAAKGETQRLNEELYPTQRRTDGFSKARATAAIKAVRRPNMSPSEAHFARADASLHHLNNMLDQVKVLENDFLANHAKR
ncbi:hypothetical protein BV898_05175 [Hypsibius exemplaris]|uniref:Uncharacterized protein n=1 Tax=Hypsibius exemplaris TaxID=2072580 RepID=A0A1W0X036_HYPEX|nr:hypothetical protein BV898_05175 [Hypsibius exemplaris]